ncbi:MAG TPA: ribosome-associated translation inhibitor RaiA [Verrucomicrobiae bacterium]|nr:ribosome-associated translation inhibitor RaiA [Verrucomicrobiae bacterium]
MNSLFALNAGTASLRDVRLHSLKNGQLSILTRADGFDVSEDLQNAVVRKIGRVRQYAPRAFRVRVQFRKEPARKAADRFHVIVHYEVPGNDVIVAHSGRDPIAALDVVSEKIERRLRKRKTARLAQRVREKRRALWANAPNQ